MSHESNDAFSGFTLFLARLWRARWYIVTVSAVFAIVTYLNLKFLTPETFRSETIIYLSEDVEAPTIKTLVTNFEMLDVVRSRFREVFPKAKGLSYLDRFAQRFHVNEEVLEDNSIRKVYSPALVLSADAHSPEQAQTLASIWLDEVVRRYGGTTGTESRFRMENNRILLDLLKNQEMQVEESRAVLQYRVAELESRLQGLIRILSPSDILDIQKPREFTTYIEGMLPKPQQVSVNVPARSAPIEPGLIEQQMKLQTERAKAEARHKVYVDRIASGGTLPEGVQEKAVDLRAEIAALQAEEESVARQIAQVRDDISSLTLALRAAKSDLAASDTELAGLRLQQDFVGSSLAKYTSNGFLSEQVSHWTEDAPARLDFAVVANPSLPDRKVAPQRLLSAILAAIIGGILTCFVIGFAHLVERLPALAEGTREDETTQPVEPDAL